MSPVSRFPAFPAAAFALLAACRGPAPVPTVTLAAAADTVLVPWTDVTDAEWLGGSRWAIVSASERRVAIVDLASRRIVPTGRPGSTYDHPFSVFAARDSLFVGDWGRRRLVVWGGAGRLPGTLPALDALHGVLPAAADGQGRFYAELRPASRADGSGNRDSAAVVRFDRTAGRTDTVARLAPLDLAVVDGDAGRRFERRVFSGTDRWGVLPDGSVWVARVYQNRVDWLRPHQPHLKGHPLPDRVLQVMPADREVFLQHFPQELRPMAEQLPFAPIKPPFVNAFGRAADTTVWLEKSRAYGDTLARLQVVDGSGALRTNVQYRGDGQVAGVSTDALLIGEQYAEGVRLLVYRSPCVVDLKRAERECLSR